MDVEEQLRVYIPSFVIRSTVPREYFHLDYVPSAGSNGLTLMAPLFDMSEVDGCHLLWKDEAGVEHVYGVLIAYCCLDCVLWHLDWDGV